MLATRDFWRTPVRPRRGFRPTVGALEGRELMATGPLTFEATYGVVGLDGYYRSGVIVNFAPYEAGVNPSTIQTYYRINTGPIVAGRSVALMNDGFYDVTYFSVDSAGHVGPIGSQVVAIDHVAPSVTAFASPSSLWPPNNKLDPVVVAGHVSDDLSGAAPYVFYAVADSEGTYEPSGIAPVDRNGNFSFVVYLQASRLGQDKSGRVYTIDVFGLDDAGNAGVGATTVTVPHDQGKGNG